MYHSLLLALALTQPPSVDGVRLAAFGGRVEVASGAEFVPALRGQIVPAGAKIRVGPAAFAHLEFAHGSVTIGDDAEIELRVAGKAVHLRIERGRSRWTLQDPGSVVEFAAGRFRFSETPADVEFFASGNGTRVAVLSGAIQPESLDAGKVTFGAGPSPARTFTAGRIRNRDGFLVPDYSMPLWILPQVYPQINPPRPDPRR